MADLAVLPLLRMTFKEIIASAAGKVLIRVGAVFAVVDSVALLLLIPDKHHRQPSSQF